MKIKIKKIYSDAQLPEYKREGDAAMDFYSYDEYELKPGERHVYRTGVALELPDGYALMLWSRSSLGFKHGITHLAGLIDANFRGEIQVCLLNTSNESHKVEKGHRLIQGVIQKVEQVELEEVEELSESIRGENWKGSTGY